MRLVEKLVHGNENGRNQIVHLFPDICRRSGIRRRSDQRFATDKQRLAHTRQLLEQATLPEPEREIRLRVGQVFPSLGGEHPRAVESDRPNVPQARGGQRRSNDN